MKIHTETETVHHATRIAKAHASAFPTQQKQVRAADKLHRACIHSRAQDVFCWHAILCELPFNLRRPTLGPRELPELPPTEQPREHTKLFPPFTNAVSAMQSTLSRREFAMIQQYPPCSFSNVAYSTELRSCLSPLHRKAEGIKHTGIPTRSWTPTRLSSCPSLGSYPETNSWCILAPPNCPRPAPPRCPDRCPA